MTTALTAYLQELSRANIAEAYAQQETEQEAVADQREIELLDAAIGKHPAFRRILGDLPWSVAMDGQGTEQQRLFAEALVDLTAGVPLITDAAAAEDLVGRLAPHVPVVEHINSEPIRSVDDEIVREMLSDSDKVIYDLEGSQALQDPFRRSDWMDERQRQIFAEATHAEIHAQLRP